MDYIVINHRANKIYRYGNLDECRSFVQHVGAFLRSGGEELYWDEATASLTERGTDTPVLSIGTENT